jgi:Na+-driven multidrug efflux pump
MVSNLIGQGRKDQVILLIRKIVKISVSFALMEALLLNIFPRVFLSIYGQSPDFIIEAIPVVRVVSIALIMMSFGTIWLNSVTGTGNTRINLAIEVITIVFYSIYVYMVLAYFNLPLLYGWMSEWVYWSFTFGMSFWYMRSGKWRLKVI